MLSFPNMKVHRPHGQNFVTNGKLTSTRKSKNTIKIKASVKGAFIMHIDK